MKQIFLFLTALYSDLAVCAALTNTATAPWALALAGGWLAMLCLQLSLAQCLIFLSFGKQNW